MTIDVTAGGASAVAFDGAANADTYFTARGVSTWTGTDAVKEAALVRGADYLENRYRGRWVGYKATQTQALSWPRSWVEDAEFYPVASDAIPEEVKRANFEAALLILTGTNLEPALERGGMSRRTRVKAGPVETETEYTGGAPARVTVTAIDGLLRGLLRDDSTIPLERV